MIFIDSWNTLGTGYAHILLAINLVQKSLFMAPLKNAFLGLHLSDLTHNGAPYKTIP